jgi:predicted phosphodiesterase/biotin operon repressor
MVEKADISTAILKEKKPFSADVLATALGVGVEIVTEAIAKLESEGYSFARSGEKIVKSKAALPETIFDASKILHGRHLIFGVVADTHLGSKHARADLLEQAYESFETEGVKTVFHCGDLTDGWGVYRGQEFELTVIGQEDQITHAREVYPKSYRATTMLISGNHDLREYERGGADPLVQICRDRRDLVYLGQMAAKVKIGNVTAELLHPFGGTAYALSYKAQKEINARSPNDLPDILMYGHYHTSFYMHYRNLHFLQVPSLKDPGVWERRLGLNTTLGFWVVNATLSDDLAFLQKFQPELFTFRGKKKA